MTKFSVLVDGDLMQVTANTVAIVPDIVVLHLRHKHSLENDKGVPFVGPRDIRIVGVG